MIPETSDAADRRTVALSPSEVSALHSATNPFQPMGSGTPAPAMQALFLEAAPGRAGQRLCLYHAPTGTAARGAIVYVHPLAEEMNKSRRMAALQSRAFAAAGFAVLQIDLLGCGDSSGDFADATWDDWVQDTVLAVRWLRSRHPAPMWLWGLRSGCLVASDAAAHVDADVNRLYWQPPVSGRAPLQQFLRLALVADLIGTPHEDRNKRPSAAQVLALGQPVEVAGYTVGPALTAGLESARLQPAQPGARTVWLEVSARADAVLLPASQAALEEWRRNGRTVDAAVARGPAFWQTTEIEDAPGLVELTLSMLAGR